MCGATTPQEARQPAVGYSGNLASNRPTQIPVTRNTELRQAVLCRDNYLCVNCDEIAFHAHHIVPIAKGGRDHIRNMVSLCHLCHRSVHGLSSVSMSELVKTGKIHSKSSKSQKRAKKNTGNHARRHRFIPEFNGKIAFNRADLLQRWAISAASPSLEILAADRNRLRDRLRMGWLLSCPKALVAIPAHDWLAVERLSPKDRRPFAPNRVRVTLAQKVAVLQDLGVGALMERFGRGEVISATDPAVVVLHATATAHATAITTALGDLFEKKRMANPGKLPSGTLRNLLRAVGWELTRVGRIHTRGDDRGCAPTQPHRSPCLRG